jgi:hypothetical protein
LISAVDRCMAPDPAERPHNIEQLRDVLGIVSLGSAAIAKPAGLPFDVLDSDPSPAAPAPAAPTPAAPAPATAGAGSMDTMSTSAATVTAAAPTSARVIPAPVHATTAEPFTKRSPGLGRRQRWAIAAGGAAVLVAIALVMFAEMRDSGSIDHIVLTQPESQPESQSQSQPQAGPAAQSPAPTAPPAATDSAVAAVPGAAGATGTPDPNAAAANTAQTDGSTVTGADAAAGAVTLDPDRPAPAAGAGASYRLRIQPWGAIYVDGVERGVSPPIKRLVLAPGKHTLRVTNPAFPDRVLEVDTARGGGQVVVNFNDAR